MSALQTPPQARRTRAVRPSPLGRRPMRGSGEADRVVRPLLCQRRKDSRSGRRLQTCYGQTMALRSMAGVLAVAALAGCSNANPGLSGGRSGDGGVGHSGRGDGGGARDGSTGASSSRHTGGSGSDGGGGASKGSAGTSTSGDAGASRGGDGGHASPDGSAGHSGSSDAGDSGEGDARTAHSTSTSSSHDSTSATSTSMEECTSFDYACDAGCGGGVVSTCDILSPSPGYCGGVEVATDFCPFGCNQQNPEAHCNYYPTADGGLCEASSVTITGGMLMPSDGGAAQAVCARLAATVRVTVATSLGAACLGGADAGTAVGAGSGAFLTLLAPLNATGTFPATGAQLTVWKDGMLVLDREPATSGSVTLTMQEYIPVSYGSGGSGTQGGNIGSYDVTFGSDVEKGTFIAPLCDACTASQ